VASPRSEPAAEAPAAPKREAEVDAVGLQDAERAPTVARNSGVALEAPAEARRQRESAAPATPAVRPLGLSEMPASHESTRERFRALAARAASNAEQWRALAAAWTAFAFDAATSSPQLADEAAVRALQAALEAWRASGDPSDERAFLEGASRYLAQPSAAQKPRVRALVAAAPSR
jgi:hypothetical protein